MSGARAPETRKRLRTAPLGADTGHEYRTAKGTQIGHLVKRGADDHAHRPELSPRDTVEGPRRVDDRLGDAAPVDDGALDARALRVRCGSQDEYPSVVGGGDLEQWHQGAEAQVGRGGHRIGRQRALAHPGLRVGGHGRSDVAALGIGEDKNASTAQGGGGAFQHCETCGPVGLEERDLWLDDGKTREGLHADVAEPGQTVRGDGQSPSL